MTYNKNNNSIQKQQEEKEEIVDTYPKNFKPSHKGYKYFEVDQNSDIFRLQVEFFIRKERLDIIEQIADLKYNGSFSLFVQEAIMELVELDLNSHESIAFDFCKKLLKKWDMNPESESTKRKSLQYPVSE